MMQPVGRTGKPPDDGLDPQAHVLHGLTGMSVRSLVLEELRCRSLFHQGGEGARADFEEVRPPFASTPVHVARARDVLYLPELRLQVAGDNIVPEEAILSPWALGFEIERDFQGAGSKYRSPFECTHVDQEVCILANFYSRNFYHWVTEELIKVTVLERSGFSGQYVLADLPRFAFEFMEMLGIPARRIIGHVDRPSVFKSAYFVTAIHGHNVLDYREVVFATRDAILAAADPREPTMPRRVWMDRAAGVNNQGRELVNAEEVYAILARYGFTILDMATLPVRRQVAIAREAAVLGGPHGAGFAHALFMAPQSAVIECYSPLFLNPGVFDICRAMKHRYSMLVYQQAYERYAFGDGIKVNLSLLELVLQGLS